MNLHMQRLNKCVRFLLILTLFTWFCTFTSSSTALGRGFDSNTGPDDGIAASESTFAGTTLYINVGFNQKHGLEERSGNAGRWNHNHPSITNLRYREAANLHPDYIPHWRNAFNQSISDWNNVPNGKIKFLLDNTNAVVRLNVKTMDLGIGGSAECVRHPTNWYLQDCNVFGNTRYNYLNLQQKREITIHELGHALGLSHTIQIGQPSVMVYYSSGYVVPQHIDRILLNSIYP